MLAAAVRRLHDLAAAPLSLLVEFDEAQDEAWEPFLDAWDPDLAELEDLESATPSTSG